MKTKSILFLFFAILPTLLFSQDERKTKEIYFEGTVETESLYDGTFSISVQITKGDLAGNIEDLYFNVGFNDANSIEYKGNAEISGAGDSIGKKIKGTIIESTGEFEIYDGFGGTETKKCYRPIELNWM